MHVMHFEQNAKQCPRQWAVRMQNHRREGREIKNKVGRVVDLITEDCSQNTLSLSQLPSPSQQQQNPI